MRSTENRYKKEVETLQAEIAALTPNIAKFEVLDLVEVGPHMVVKVKYPSCTRCSFEGVKIMVFLNTNAVKAIRWKKIDPHFRDDSKTKLAVTSINEAPSPTARFPNTEAGWQDAVAYATGAAEAVGEG